MYSRTFRSPLLAFLLGASACATRHSDVPASNIAVTPPPSPEATETAPRPIPSAPPASSASAATSELDAGEAAVRDWLQVVDAEKYGESWRAASKVFQSGVSEQAWVNAAGSARRPLGQERTRKLKSITFKTSLPGAPDGKYVLVEFDSVFANKAAAVETVTAMQEGDGTWRVAGYFVR